MITVLQCFVTCEEYNPKGKLNLLITKINFDIDTNVEVLSCNQSFIY